MNFPPKHTATKAQQTAFNGVIKAIKSAQRKGLIFYGKQDSLVAYTTSADSYIQSHDFNRLLHGNGDVIPHLSKIILSDSGADDYPCYLNADNSI